MIVCVYGRSLAPFVEPVAHDVCVEARAMGADIRAVTVEAALAQRDRCADVRHLYVLPFDISREEEGNMTAVDVMRTAFPNATPFTSFGTQDLCWDKVATQQRLLDRGLPFPETLVTADPQDVAEFVRQHRFAILKERMSCAGAGHIVLWFEEGQLLGDGGSHRYVVELVGSGARELHGDRLFIPGPFYVQRLVADLNAGAVRPGSILRAYVVDRQIVFWTERYRENYSRPADWIISAARGARYRFVLDVSEEARKMALRCAEALGLRAGVVDLVRTSRGGLYVLEADTDGVHMIVDRSFKDVPEYRDFFNFDRYIAEALLRELEAPAETAVRRIGGGDSKRRTEL
jgi:glutathione synthase/RimK-type ligase-like ATP-grasp enzyme